MGQGLLRTAGALALIATLMAATVVVQDARERRYPARPEVEEALYLTSGTLLRRLTLAYPSLAADLYWIRAIQYYGGIKRKVDSGSRAIAPPRALVADPAVEYRLLHPLLDLTTALDPRFNVAYRFGAVFLAEPYPGGPGRADLAIALLEKGLRERPDKWEYMYDIGFVHYWYTHDFRMASAWFGKAGNVPGAPWWIRSLAATTLAQGGDRRSSRQLWTAIRQSAEIEWLQKDAERRLLQLRALDEMEAIQQRLEAYFAKGGARATDWRTLSRAGVVPGRPLDPSGTPYELSPEGLIKLSQTSPLWPLPEEPQARRAGPPS